MFNAGFFKLSISSDSWVIQPKNGLQYFKELNTETTQLTNKLFHAQTDDLAENGRGKPETGFWRVGNN